MEFLKISSIISSAIGFLLADFFFFFAYIETRVRKRKDLTYVLMAFFFLGSSMAAFGLTMLYYTVANPSVSRFWEQFMHLGLFILTPVWVHFIFYYFFSRKFSFFIGLVYAINASCIILTYAGTLFFVTGPGAPFKNCLSFTYGPLYNPMLVLYFATITFVFIRTLVVFKSSSQPTITKLLFVIGATTIIATGFKDMAETFWITPLPQLFPYGVLVAAFLHFWIMLIRMREMDKEYEHQKDVERELITAQNIQRYFVPPRLDMDNWYYQLCAINRPGQYLGGDFYQVIQYSPHEFLLYMGDVTGKGVGASLYMSFLFSYFKSLPRIGSPSDLDGIVTKANLIMKENSRQNMFVTLFIAYVDLNKRKIHFINAGHLYPPFFTGPDKKSMALLNTAGMPLGIDAGQQYRHDTIDINEQDVLCLFTDGLSESFELNGSISGEDYLHNLIREKLFASPAVIVDDILEEQSRIGRKEMLLDDLTFLVLKIKSLA